MSWTVYRHITPSGKSYIGITSRKPEERWKNGNGYIKDTPFGKAIEKYRWENIKHEILDTDLDEFEAKCLEEYYIFSFRTFVGFSYCNGYNCTLGGEGVVGHHHTPWNKGISPSEESRIKNSEAHKGKTPWNKGIPMDDEIKRKISESNKCKPSPKKGIKKGKPSSFKGKHHTEESRRKLSEANKGKHPTEETRHKLSEAKKGKPSNTKGKHWKLIDGKRVYYK